MINFASIEATNMRRAFYDYRPGREHVEDIDKAWRKAKKQWLEMRLKALELPDGTYYKPGVEYVNLVYSMM